MALKKVLIITLLLLIVYTALPAEGLRLGIRGGLSLTRPISDASGSSREQAGFSGDLLFQKVLMDRLALEIYGGYAHNGFETDLMKLKWKNVRMGINVKTLLFPGVIIYGGAGITYLVEASVSAGAPEEDITGQLDESGYFWCAGGQLFLTESLFFDGSMKSMVTDMGDVSSFGGDVLSFRYLEFSMGIMF